MSGKALEYFFDYSCPYAYLGSTRVEQVAAASGVPVVWRPMLLGGVFRELGTPQNMAASLHPSKARHNVADMMRWADLWGVTLRIPAQHPLRTVEALRTTLACPAERRPALIHRIFRAYWVDNADIGELSVLEELLAELDLDRSLAGPHASAVKDGLRANTNEAVSRGVFGAPTSFVDGHAYWGQDRLWMVARALGAPEAQGPLAHLPSTAGKHTPNPPRSFEFWYDFSSPFTYLAATQVEEIAARHSAEAIWRPFLLGGLFKALGGPMVPLAEFPKAKARFVAQDMQRWADYWQVPYRWPTRFPIRTILPLRVALALGPDAKPFALRTFRAYWAEDQDISDPDVVRQMLAEVGLDPNVVDRTEAPEIKSALVANTNAAVEAGLFGAPSFVVGGQLFWGQDRLGLIERVLEGWIPPGATGEGPVFE